jgi:dephospho-CoA kinase
MLHVGLTGGISSGKSLVAHTLRDLGASIIDADRIVSCLLEPEQPAWLEVRKHFGETIVLPNKRIDKRKLGEIVFSNEIERAWLNKELHPRVFHAFQAQVRGMHSRPPDTVIIFDAALLIETGYHENMDRIIVVYAEPGQQLERLMARDCFTKEQALARIQAQMPLKEKRGHADFVIDNTGSREKTEEQVKSLYVRLRQEAGQNS